MSGRCDVLGRYAEVFAHLAEHQSRRADPFDFDLYRTGQAVLERNSRPRLCWQVQLHPNHPVAGLGGYPGDSSSQATILRPREAVQP